MGQLLQFPKRKVTPEDIAQARTVLATIVKINTDHHARLAKERSEKSKKVLKKFKTK